MKRFKSAILLSLIFSCPLWAETYSSLDTALRAAIVSKKPLMVVVMLTTCPYCADYWENVINADGVFEALNAEFIIYESYLDKGGVYPSEAPWSGVVPATYFFAPNGQIIGEPLVGLIPLERFIDYANLALDYVYQSGGAYMGGER